MSDAPVAEVRDSRGFWAVVSCASFAIGSLTVATGLFPPALPIMAGYAVWAAWRAIVHEVRVTVTDEGLQDRSFWFSPGLLPWAEIRDVHRTRWGYIEVELIDEQGFWDRLSPIQSLARIKWQLLGLGPSLIYPWALEGSTDELVDALQDGLDRYTVRAAMEAPALGDTPGLGEAPALGDPSDLEPPT